MAIRLDHGSDELTEVHEINVVPFIDVMLVLLIIFMVAAAHATVVLAVHPPVAPSALTATLDALSGCNKEDRIFLRADRTVHYGEVMQVMNDLRSAGYLKIALVALETREAK